MSAQEFMDELGDNPSKAEMSAAAGRLRGADMTLSAKKQCARKLAVMMRDAGMPEHPVLRAMMDE